MDFQINCTADGVKTYPLHKHSNYEVMYYLQGQGVLRTPDKSYPFSPGSIIIVPSQLEHGSSSKNGFKNISICGNFKHLLFSREPVVLSDNEYLEGKSLAELIFKNRFSGNEYLMSLCSAYIHFLLQSIENKDSVSKAVDKIIKEITSKACDSSINLSSLLLKSGYAEDYIRSHFKRITGKTPNEFLTQIRINRACYLISIYGSSLSLSEIAEQCGYTDYIYFSKKFKSVTAMSPRKYKASI